MKNEIIELTEVVTLTQNGPMIVSMEDNQKVTLYMRDSYFCKKISVTGFESIDEVIGKIFVHRETYVSGGMPFCLLMKNGALHWLSLDDTDTLIRLLQNEALIREMTNLELLKRFIEF
jgi:diaminopimelate epimerase